MSDCGPNCIAVAIVIRDGKVLIGRRPEHVPLGGLWEFPGGKVGPGESAADAAVRECLEETGVKVRVERERMVVDHDYDYGNVRIHFFDAVPLEPDRQPASPFRWVEIRALDRYAFPAANQRVVAQLRETLLSL